MPNASWGRACTGSIKTLVRSDGVKLPVRLELLELVKLLCDETERLGYNLVPGWCWGYACRDIRGRPGIKSNHAWGLAVDLNAPENPMGPRTGKIRKFPAVIALWERYGFRSGTKYSGRADDMHMEFMGSVADAAAQTARARRELGGQKSEAAPPFTLTPGQIKWLAKSVGLSDDEATIAVAVALAESDGVVKAFNGKAPDASYGLWQINMHGPLGPARRAEYGLKSNEELFDPFVNARAMKAIRTQAKNWRTWGAFTNGSYLKHLPKATTAKPEPVLGVAPTRLEEDVIRIITTTNGDGTRAGVYVESNMTFVRWVPNPAVWDQAKRYAVEGTDEPVLVPRIEFDLLEKVGQAPKEAWPT